jgi:hypothetical protein
MAEKAARHTRVQTSESMVGVGNVTTLLLAETKELENMATSLKQ